MQRCESRMQSNRLRNWGAVWKNFATEGAKGQNRIKIILRTRLSHYLNTSFIEILQLHVIHILNLIQIIRHYAMELICTNVKKVPPFTARKFCTSPSRNGFYVTKLIFVTNLFPQVTYHLFHSEKIVTKWTSKSPKTALTEIGYATGNAYKLKNGPIISLPLKWAVLMFLSHIASLKPK